MKFYLYSCTVANDSWIAKNVQQIIVVLQIANFNGSGYARIKIFRTVVTKPLHFENHVYILAIIILVCMQQECISLMFDTFFVSFYFMQNYCVTWTKLVVCRLYYVA